MKEEPRIPYSRWSIVLPLCLAFLVASGAAPPAEGASDSESGRVIGIVSDSGKAPLAQALVTFSTQPASMEVTVITGRDGSFGVDLRAGAYQMTADLRGYARSEPQHVTVQAGQKAEIKVGLKPLQDSFDLESQITGAELLNLLPEDSRRMLIHRCASCHTMGVLGGQRMSKASWGKIVDRMALLHPDWAGRGEVDALAPWEELPWKAITELLAKHFGPAVESYRYDPFPIRNTSDNLARTVVKEYLLKRPETVVHDIALDASGKRIWYDDQEVGGVIKTGLFGWYEPATGESKEYQVSQCPGFLGRVLTDKAGRVWIACLKTLAQWAPSTDQVTTFPMGKYQMNQLWTVDSKGNAYSILRARIADPEGDPKFSYFGKFNTHTREWNFYKVPTAWGRPYEAAPDSQDNIWFTEIAVDKIGKLDGRTGKFTEYLVPTKSSAPRRMAIDSKDNVWFTEFAANKIGMVDSQTGKVTDYELPAPYSIPYACGVDKNDMVWFSEIGALRLARFDPKTKTFREYPIPDRFSSIKNLTFTYSDGKEIIWGSDATGPKIIAFEIPNE